MTTFLRTVDSALASLARAGIAPERITIKKAGRGWQKDRMVQQSPSAGSPLTDDVAVELTVEGDGLFSRLPTGMRDLGPDPEREPGIHELAALFDDPIDKAAYYVRQGGLYFDVRPDNALGCARWIRLFGIDPADWPRESWYPLAVLLPRLQDLAGREAGLRLALKILLDLDVAAIDWRARRTRLSPEALSRFGERASRLGIDLIVGDGMEDEAALDITFGPGLSAHLSQASDGRGDAKNPSGAASSAALPCGVFHTLAGGRYGSCAAVGHRRGECALGD